MLLVGTVWSCYGWKETHSPLVLLHGPVVAGRRPTVRWCCFMVLLWLEGDPQSAGVASWSCCGWKETLSPLVLLHGPVVAGRRPTVRWCCCGLPRAAQTAKLSGPSPVGGDRVKVGRLPQERETGDRSPLSPGQFTPGAWRYNDQCVDWLAQCLYALTG